MSSDEPGSPSANSKKKQKSLILEIQKQNVEKAREKLSKGLDPNFWTETEGIRSLKIETPLSFAVMNNDKDMISLLIEAGAFLDYRVGSKDGWKTPLHIAALHNKALALQTLISFGAWVNAVDLVGLTPLSYAITGDNAECAHRLLLAKADPEVHYDENKKSMLHQACINNNEYTVGLLTDFGADINCQNQLGNTPLHLAATRNAKGCVRWLLMRGANTEILNKYGQTAAAAASVSGKEEMAEMIKNFKLEHIGLLSFNF